MFTHSLLLGHQEYPGSSFLASIFESTNEFWNVVIIVLSGVFLVIKRSELGLKELVLLRANLLKDIWHHVLELFGLWASSNNQKIFSDRELGYEKNKNE